MAAPIPCPCCGSDIGPGHEACAVCAYAFGSDRESNATGSKCARCAAVMPSGFDFCPVCGQDQRTRLRRPPTELIGIATAARARAPGPVAPPVLTSVPPSRDGSLAGATAAGLTVPAPGSGSGPGSVPSFVPPTPPPMPSAPPMGYAPMPAVDRTVPAPSANRPSPLARPPAPSAEPPPRQTVVVDPAAPAAPPTGQGSLIAAIEATDTMKPPAGMPAIESGVSDDDRTVPQAKHRHPVSDDDRTVPHQMRSPVAIAPVRANISPATQPDRPGGFSGGPGHGPLPTVNRRGGTLAPIQPGDDEQGSVGQPAVASGPRLVLVARDGSEGESFPLTGQQMTVGRTHGDLLFPEDPFLSPMHIRLERTPKGMGIFDAGSTNGVYLRIRGGAPVYPGDSFMIGHQLLRLENIDTQVQERPPAIDGTRVFGTPLQPAWGCVRQVGRGGIVGDKYYLRGSQVVFGREGGDLLFPNDPFVSREHARLRLELHGQSMAVFLEDLESANGSYIRIRGSAEMGSMDTFRIGDQILRLRLD